MADNSEAPQPAKPISITDSVHLIPGIGIVRARALEKAGFATLADLKPRKVEDLTAIRGISEIKAQQILDFVASLKAAPPRTRRTAAPRAPSPQPLPPPDSPAVLDGLIREAAKEISRVSAELLRSPNSAHFNKKLARQLGKLAFFGERLGANGPPAAANSERFASRLNKLKDILANIASAPEAKGGKQDKLAAKLRSSRKELQNTT